MTVSIDSIVPNEMVVKTMKPIINGKPYISHNFEKFAPSKYAVVADLLHRMSPTVRAEYLSKSYFEIAIDERSMDATGSSFMVLTQLARLTRTLDKIKNLVVKIEVPLDGCIAIVASNSEYKTSSTRQFLLETVQGIQSFKALKQMDILLSLPQGLTEASIRA